MTFNTLAVVGAYSGRLLEKVDGVQHIQEVFDRFFGPTLTNQLPSLHADLQKKLGQFDHRLKLFTEAEFKRVGIDAFISRALGVFGLTVDL